MSELLGAHLVGSINLPNAETVMRAAAELLGPHLARIPDGEVGERFHWIAFQPDRLAGAAGLERVGAEPIVVAGLDVRPLRIADGVDPDAIELPPLGYADAATGSWQTFQLLQSEGVIAPGTRFQVSLPTPAAVVGAFIAREDRERFEPVYRRALYGELQRVVELVPAERLAIQWDTAVEFGFIEAAGYAKNNEQNDPWFDDVWSGVIDRAVDQAAQVPEGVQLGFHLCYGDIAEKHFVEPGDTANLVRFATELLDRAPRRVDWLHMPVPIERDDDAYYAPLGDLALPAGTDLYLGLMHREDLVEGALRRIAVAQRYVDRFGVATECGFGRAPASATEPLFRAHAEVVEASRG